MLGLICRLKSGRQMSSLKGYQAVNEPVLEYRPGSKESKELEEALKRYESTVFDVPIIIGEEEIRLKDARAQVRVSYADIYSSLNIGGTLQATDGFQDSDTFQKAIKMVFICILTMICHLPGFTLMLEKRKKKLYLHARRKTTTYFPFY